jgi:hypothetical protein
MCFEFVIDQFEIRNPTTAGDVHWEPYNIHTKKYMDIGEKLVLKNNLSEERYALWRKLFPVSGY